MQDMFEKTKRMANTAIERATWEADKLRRSSARQRDIDLAQRERTIAIEQISHVVLDLEQRGQLPQEGLKALAQRLRTLDEEIAHGHRDIEAIRQETFAPGSVAISVTRHGDANDSPCPTCGRPNRSDASFCSNCGARLR
jgi:uncharacterized coiled-coil protein SlyX